ncbi:MAG: hypothetical protein KDD62_12660, partial [Bdellovibrionales bacterium]|nr:hypothetical protein [Bdellovibrionales bacterium]
MDPVTGLVAGQAIQTLAKAALGDSESSSSESSQDFSTQLARLLSPDPANNINEEELYAGLIEERIGATKGEEAAQAFAESFAAKKAEMARGDGYIPVEDAANAALEEMVASGALSADEAKTIGDQAFQAAQLDDNLDALYDSRGGGNDPTIATASMEVALAKAKDALTSLGVSIAGGDSEEASDTETEASVSDATEANVETITPNGTTIDG